MAEAFLYMWENWVSGKRYVGVHKGSPDDGYVASSKLFMEDYQVAPHLFVRTILATGTFADMVREEASYLTFSDAKNDPTYYNQHNGDGNFYCVRWPKKSREKVTGRKKPEHGEKIKALWKDPEYRAKQHESRSKKGRRPDVAIRMKGNAYSKGKTWKVKDTTNYKKPRPWMQGRTWKWSHPSPLIGRKQTAEHVQKRMVRYEHS